jgi:hypothetical protein
MLIATTIKQAKDNNLSSKLHVLELLITLLYMENEKGGEEKGGDFAFVTPLETKN